MLVISAVCLEKVGEICGPLKYGGLFKSDHTGNYYFSLSVFHALVKSSFTVFIGSL